MEPSDIERIGAAVARHILEGIEVSSREVVDYRELARRLQLGVKTARAWVREGIIEPLPGCARSNLARFHWPSVLEQLKRRKGRR
jgi:hypothetical protein